MSKLEAFFLLLDIFVRTSLNPLYGNLFAIRPTSDQFNEIDNQRSIASSRVENIRVYVYMLGVMGMMALASVFADNKTQLINWLIVSFIFSLAMFMIFKSLLLAVRGVRHFSRVKQPIN